MIVRSRTAVVGTAVGRIAVAGIVADHIAVVGTAVVVSTGMVVGQTVVVVVAIGLWGLIWIVTHECVPPLFYERFEIVSLPLEKDTHPQ